VIRTRVDSKVAHVMLDRPEALNAITTGLARALECAVRDLAGSANVIVIRGTGGNFSVGGDFREVERLRGEGRAALAELFHAFGAACEAIAQVPVPVLAAVEGYALAAGFELMQACDVAIVSEDAKLADHHARAGVIPGGGSTQRLPRLIGCQRALGLILTGDHIGGPEAAALGLAYRCVPAVEFDDAVDELARRLAGRDRETQAQIKRLVRDGIERPLPEGLAAERAAVVELLAREGAVAWRS
jgi:enoyl-CoA hydratase/carnithine racemase